MDWTEDMIARIRALWAEGHSTAEIGRQMGVTKNSIVGKAHRLALPARPSPIRKMADGAPRQRPPRPEISRPTNFPAREQHGFAPRSPHAFAPRPFFPATRPRSLYGEIRGHHASGPDAPLARDGSEAPTSPGARTPSTPALERAYRVGLRSQPCCWPIGQPRTPEFRFCNAASLGSRPYCDEHFQVAYVKVPRETNRFRGDRREDGPQPRS